MPIPVRVIGDLLGVPAVLRLSFRTAVEPLLTRDRSGRGGQRPRRRWPTLLRRLIRDKRHDPGRDLVTALIEARDNGDQLSDDELLTTAYLLILAGYETTVNLIGNASLALLRNPSQLAALRDQPSMLPAAVEEFLRYESPINIATIRYTTVRIRVDDVDIPANEFVMIALLAANRDDEQFDDSEQLDIGRKPNAHLAFGHGIHYCVGAPLARMEAEIALGRMLARFGRIALDDAATVQYRTSTLTRALEISAGATVPDGEELSRPLWAAAQPWADGLNLRAQGQQRCFVKRSADELDGQREALTVEPPRDDSRRLACHVERLLEWDVSGSKRQRRDRAAPRRRRRPVAVRMRFPG